MPAPQNLLTQSHHLHMHAGLTGGASVIYPPRLGLAPLGLPSGTVEGSLLIDLWLHFLAAHFLFPFPDLGSSHLVGDDPVHANRSFSGRKRGEWQGSISVVREQQRPILRVLREAAVEMRKLMFTCFTPRNLRFSQFTPSKM